MSIKNQILSNKKFYIIEFIFILLIFIFNANHVNQQGTYYNVFLQIADNIKNGFGYTTEYDIHQSAFYPLWGYTLITVLDFAKNGFIPFFIQFILAFIGIEFLFKVFNAEKKYIYLFGLLPFIAIMSMRAPDAIVAFLIIIFIYNLNKSQIGLNKYSVFSGLTLGLIYNFRSEYSFFILLIFAISLIFKNYRKYSKNLIYIAIISYALILPWGIRSYFLNNEFRISSTNGGSVAYITLGQLQNNKWGIVANDTTALGIAKSIGEINQYTPKADKYFSSLFIKAINEEKTEYLKKATLNLLKVFTSGVYTGEYSTQLKVHDYYDSYSKINNAPGTLDKIKTMFNLPMKDSLIIILDKFIYLIFVVFNLFIVFYFLILLFRRELKYNSLLLISIVVFFILKLAIVSLLQYEYRHINPLYTLIYFPVILNLKSIKLWKKKNQTINQ